MDDSPVMESTSNANANANVPVNEEDEIDPLDAYMLEIDKQVKALQSKDVQMSSTAATIATEEQVPDENENENESESEEEEAAEDEDVKLKTGNFTSVEELIA